MGFRTGGTLRRSRSHDRKSGIWPGLYTVRPGSGHGIVSALSMRTHLFWVVLAGLVILAAVVFAGRAKSQMYDFEVYRVAATRVVAGESIFRVEDGHWQFKYFPAFACLLTPLALLPPVAARAAWFFLTLALVVVLVRWSLALLPGRRRTVAFLVTLTVLALGKYYVREIGLGQSNALLAVLAVAAVAQWRAGRDARAGALLAAATIVKPYAILFLPYLLWRRRLPALAAFIAVLVAAALLPALRYGFAGNLELLGDWWTTVTTSTAPNLAGQDNVSIAGMYAAWFGVGRAAGMLAALSGAVLVLASGLAIARRTDAAHPEYFDAALLLFLIPLLSPQGWDYVLLVSTPAVLLLIDRLEAFARPLRVLLLACLALAGLTFWDVLGREPYRLLMMSRVITVGALIQVALLLRLRWRGLA
jgi:hypothetical protein